MNLRKIYFYLKSWNLWEDEAGLGMVELAIIIVIIIGLAVIFKGQVEGLLVNVFEKIDLDVLDS